MDCKSVMRNYSRYLLIIFNFFFALTGILIVSIGATVKAYYNEYQSFLNEKYIYASDLLIIVGVIIFIIAFFGCCGAVKENACMTTTFSSLLIVVFILELMVGIGGVILKHKTEDLVEQTLRTTLLQYDNPNANETTALWDQIQREFHCCGVVNYTDWKNITATELPMSCCDIPAGAFGPYNCDANNTHLHRIGCWQVFSDYIEGHATTIEGVGIGLAVLQVLGILLSCYLAKQIRSDYETV